jgi:hypothetical protein
MRLAKLSAAIRNDAITQPTSFAANEAVPRTSATANNAAGSPSGMIIFSQENGSGTQPPKIIV